MPFPAMRCNRFIAGDPCQTTDDELKDKIFMRNNQTTRYQFGHIAMDLSEVSGEGNSAAGVLSRN